MSDDRVEIETIASPGRTERVSRARNGAMRRALPAASPGARAALLPHGPDDLSPAGKTPGSRLKAVRFDREAGSRAPDDRWSLTDGSCHSNRRTRANDTRANLPVV